MGFRAFVLTAAVAFVAVPVAHAQAPGEPTGYCTPDGGASGQATDHEHTIVVGDRPPPAGIRRYRVTVDGITTPVMEKGPPLAEEAAVFIHGNPGSSRDFDELLADADPHIRVVAFDMPGMGHASDPLEGPYTTDGAAAFIDHMLARLGIKHVHLVLHDFGGPWGLQWGAAHGDLLSSVVLIDTGVLINYVGHPAAIVWHTPVTGEVSMATLTRDSFKADLQAENPKPFPSQFLDRMYDDYDRYTRCAVLSYYRSIANPDTLGREQAAALSNRRRPALVVWGEDDVYLPPQLLADEQKQAFPDAEIHILPGDGHWPFIDDPQRVRDLVEPFLSKWVHAPRLLAAHGPLRAGRTKPFRVDLHAEGVPVARRVDVGLYRGGARVGGLRRALSVHGRSRRPRVHLRRRLTSGRYTLRLSAPDWPVQAFPLTVR